jgi:hypothetical protein
MNEGGGGRPWNGEQGADGMGTQVTCKRSEFGFEDFEHFVAKESQMAMVKGGYEVTSTS